MTSVIQLPNIVEALENSFKNKIKVWIARSIHASAIGGCCERQLVYDQVAPTREAHTVDTEMIFSMGRLLEEQASVDLAEAFKGNDEVQVVRERLPIPPNQWNIGGQLDFSVLMRIDKHWHKFPMEFKSCSPFVFDRIKTIADMLDDESIFIRKWPAQGQIYMLMNNIDQGMFLLRNKVTGKYKQIDMRLDLDYAETLLQKAERVNNSIAAFKKAVGEEEQEKALPARIAYSGEACGNCPFKSICVPDILKAPGIENMLHDEELATYCKIRAENSDARKAFEDADSKISAHCKSVTDGLTKGESKIILVNGYTITVKMGESTKYDIPDGIKAQYAIKNKMVRKTIEVL